jgi:hypothetical protein
MTEESAHEQNLNSTIAVEKENAFGQFAPSQHGRFRYPLKLSVCTSSF